MAHSLWGGKAVSVIAYFGYLGNREFGSPCPFSENPSAYQQPLESPGQWRNLSFPCGCFSSLSDDPVAENWTQNCLFVILGEGFCRKSNCKIKPHLHGLDRAKISGKQSKCSHTR